MNTSGVNLCSLLILFFGIDKFISTSFTLLLLIINSYGVSPIIKMELLILFSSLKLIVLVC